MKSASYLSHSFSKAVRTATASLALATGGLAIRPAALTAMPQAQSQSQTIPDDVKRGINEALVSSARLETSRLLRSAETNYSKELSALQKQFSGMNKDIPG